MLKKSSLLLGFCMLLFFANFYYQFAQKIRHSSQRLQRLCLHITKSPTYSSVLSQATLCSNLNPHSKKSKEIKQLFRNWGLLHLLVASGAHVYVILKGLSWLPTRLRNVFRPLSLILLIACSGTACPILRASIQIALRPSSEYLSLGLGAFRRLSLANIIYLLLFPHDLFSLSFQLSALACYCIALAQKSYFFMNFLIFVSLYPLLIQFQAPQMSFVVFNMLLAPILSPIIMIISIALGPFKNLAIFVDPFIHKALQLFIQTQGSHQLSLLSHFHKLTRYEQVIYFLSLVFVFEFIFLILIFYKKSQIKCLKLLRP